MPVYRYIDDFSAGDSYTLIRSMDPLNSGAPVTDAWFTVKTLTSDNDAMALINIHITPASTPGFVNNYADGSCLLTFSVAPDDSQQLSPVQTYFYDIALKSSADERFTVEEGKLFTTRYVRHLLA